jgi:tyrosine phenol-lyase
MINSGDIIPGNMYFTTTKLHQELAGGTFVDVIVDEAHDPSSKYPFKGNIDLKKLEYWIDKVGSEKIPYISFEGNVNMAGGQPVSMANFRQVYELCRKHGIKVMLDATRLVENCYFIKTREPGYGEKTIAEILLEICSYSDGATMSAKKDNLVNIGGWLAVNDKAIFEKARHMVVIFEGLHTYGGLAGRDMEAMARGIAESVEYDHIRARVGQVEYLGNLLIGENIPIVQPVGGHAVFLDAKTFLPHLPQDQFPAQALASELYEESGVRSMERGVVSAGRNPETGEHNYPKLELVRLTVPRRVYTQAHMDVTAETVYEVWDRRDDVKGLRMVYEPEYLRFFQARFERIN